MRSLVPILIASILTTSVGTLRAAPIRWAPVSPPADAFANGPVALAQDLEEGSLPSGVTVSPVSRRSFELLRLTIGHTYRVQIWRSDSRPGDATGLERVGDGEADEGFSEYLRRDGSGATLGEFVADAVFQHLSLSAHPDTAILGEGLIVIQLSDLGIAADTDHDGLPDSYEDDHPPLDKFNPRDADDDHDLDGLTNLQEYYRGTDFRNADTDRDGLKDGDEVGGRLNPFTRGVNTGAPGDPTNPLKADSDRDGISDLNEVDPNSTEVSDADQTDPNSSDSDGDGFGDGTERAQKSCPLDPFSQPAEVF